jgi:hypothetical protein
MTVTLSHNVQTILAPRVDGSPDTLDDTSTVKQWCQVVSFLQCEGLHQKDNSSNDLNFFLDRKLLSAQSAVEDAWASLTWCCSNHTGRK